MVIMEGYMSIIVNHLWININGDEVFDTYLDTNTNHIKVVFIVNGNESICEYDYEEFITILKKNGWKLEKPLMRIINCTPHEVNVFLDNDTRIDYVPNKDYQIRVDCKAVEVARYNNIPIRCNWYGDVIGMPKEEELKDTLFIVSRIAYEAIKLKYPEEVVEHFMVPDGSIRDQEGKIIGCTGFAQ